MSDSEDGMRSRSGSQASSVDSDGAFDFDSDGDFSGGVRIDTIFNFSFSHNSSFYSVCPHRPPCSMQTFTVPTVGKSFGRYQHYHPQWWRPLFISNFTTPFSCLMSLNIFFLPFFEPPTMTQRPPFSRIAVMVEWTRSKMTRYCK